MQTVNIAGYQFTLLSDLPGRRVIFQEKTRALNLKGTILLSEEGINVNLAGTADAIEAFIQFLQKDPLFTDMTFRKSLSSEAPFKRMQVKIRKEIITLGQPDIHPEREKAPAISPRALKQWLDEKRDITLLDTRNDYEVKFGTFEKACHLQLNDFGEFPAAIDQLPRDKPVVMFCTGGIRCEKAALVMLKAGYSTVYQLEGGILNYFTDVGGTHYAGDCFVFDERIAVNAKLEPTGAMQCLTCQGPTSACAHDLT